MGDLLNLWERLIAAASGGAGGATLVGGRLPVQSSLTIDSNDITSIHEPAAATLAKITFATPGAGFRWVLVRAGAHYTTAVPTNGYMTVESPDDTILARVPLGIVADTLKEVSGIIGADNQALVVEVPSGGGASVARLSATVQKARVQAV